MNFQTAIKTCLTQKYATFQGRASRSEFWWFAAVVILFMVGLNWFLFSGKNGPINRELNIRNIALLVVGIPFASAAARRIHDIGRSSMLLFFPFFGLLIAFFAYAFLGVAMIFYYGSNPSEETLAQIPAYISYAPFAVMVTISGAAILWAVSLLSKPSVTGPNKYGPNPHEVSP